LLHSLTGVFLSFYWRIKEDSQSLKGIGRYMAHSSCGLFSFTGTHTTINRVFLKVCVGLVGKVANVSATCRPDSNRHMSPDSRRHHNSRNSCPRYHVESHVGGCWQAIHGTHQAAGWDGLWTMDEWIRLTCTVTNNNTIITKLQD
jgi:hypothetical protein